MMEDMKTATGPDMTKMPQSDERLVNRLRELSNPPYDSACFGGPMSRAANRIVELEACVTEMKDARAADQTAFEVLDIALRLTQIEADRSMDALRAVEPYLDAIVCYASTMSEHDGNRVAVLVRKALEAMND